MSAVKVRQSNLELLRLIAMFGVLIVHTDFGILGFPTSEELTEAPLYSITRTLIEFLAIVAVNVFVLISGWFGISFRWKSLANLLFQCGFFFFGIYLTCVTIGIEQLNALGIYKCLMMSDNGWFIKSYIGMYIFAPIMNVFVKHADRQIFKRFLICFFAFQCIYGWFSNGAPFIKDGYSAFSFMGLYMLARYYRKYQPTIVKWNGRIDLCVYFILSITSTAIFITSTWLNKPSYAILMFKYTNPLTIAAAMYLLLAFSKWKFTSTTVNSIAASCFAVYLMHFIIFPTYIREWVLSLTEQHIGIGELVSILLLLIGFFATAIVVDRIRLLIWNKLIAPHF